MKKKNLISYIAAKFTCYITHFYTKFYVTQMTPLLQFLNIEEFVKNLI